MLAFRLHAIRGHHPHRLIETDLIPSHTANLAGSRSRQNQHLQRTRRNAFTFAQVTDEHADPIDRQRGVMLHLRDLLGSGQQFVQVPLPAGGVLSLAIAADGRPIQHLLDSTAHARCRLRLGRPEVVLLENLDDMRQLDIAHLHRADDRARVRRQRRHPLRGVLCALPLRRLRANELFCALVERDLSPALRSQRTAGGGSLGNRIAPFLNCLADFARFLPSQGKRHIRESAKTDFSALPTNDNAE
ncbi:protein of unknown function [Thauera humireducens]|nr:protein of unknown function [Thauera humireducens]